MAIFQINVAKRWYERGLNSKDNFAKFFFYFAGFNALYFLWGRVDDVRNQQDKPAGEEKQIHNLLKKFNSDEANEILTEVKVIVDYLQHRRPIQRMDIRDIDRQINGCDTEGKKWQSKLIKSELPEKKLLALGSILYLIRSNLVHGSKAESGDDEKIIDNSVSALEIILNKSLLISKRELLFEG